MGDIKWFMRGLAAANGIGQAMLNGKFEPYPFSLGNLGGIGVRLGKAQYKEGQVVYVLPLCAAEVDTVFTGFNINLTWDASQITLAGIQTLDTYPTTLIDDAVTPDPDLLDGNIHYQVVENQMYILSTGIKGADISKNVVFCNVIFTIVSAYPTVSNPYLVPIDDSISFASYQTTLLYWKLYDDGNYYLTSIDDTRNSGGGIYSDIPDNKGKLADTGLPSSEFKGGLYLSKDYYVSGETMAILQLCANSSDVDGFDVQNLLGISFIIKYTDLVGNISANASYGIAVGFDGFAGIMQGTDNTNDIYICGNISRDTPGSVVVGGEEFMFFTQALVIFWHTIDNKEESFKIPVTSVAMVVTMYNEEDPENPTKLAFMKSNLSADEQRVIDKMNGDYELISYGGEGIELGTLINSIKDKGNTSIIM